MRGRFGVRLISAIFRNLLGQKWDKIASRCFPEVLFHRHPVMLFRDSLRMPAPPGHHMAGELPFQFGGPRGPQVLPSLRPDFQPGPFDDAA
ncbi:MAG: hypothetical protein NXI04_01590 [Planctomycetaceae bacterium]|nr:hypothetical protein [Planctomycetaceae bacterium]